MADTFEEEPRKHYRLKSRTITRVNDPRGTPPPVDSHTDVRRLLHENLRREERAGRFTVAEVRRRRSKRRRDFVLALIVVNGALAGLWWILPRNVVTLLFAAGGAIFFSVALAWIMFVVLDDY